jgi:hypothetical protein
MSARAYLLILLCTAASAADQPPPAIPASIPDTTTPTFACVQPELPAISKTAAQQLKAKDAQIKAYQECARQFVDERHAKALMYVALQKAEADAGNEAIKSVNAYFTSLRELQDKLQAQSSSKAKQ